MRIAAVAVMLTAVAMPAFAGRVAYIDYGRLVHSAPQTAATRNLLQKEFANRRKAIVEKQKEVKKLRQEFLDLGPGTNDLEMAAMHEKLRSATGQLKSLEHAYATRLRLRESALRTSFKNLVQSEIAAYAQTHHIEVVLREGVSFAAPGTDITSAILARLKQDYRKAQSKSEKQ